MSEQPEENPRVATIIGHAVDAVASNDAAFAEKILTALVAEFPREAIAHAYLGWVLSHSGRNREAIAHGRVAVQLAPKSERVSMLYFRVLWGAGERNEALNEVKRFTAVGHSEEYSIMLDAWAETDD